MNTLKKAINKLINCTEEEVSTVGEGGTTGDHCYGDHWPVWAVSQPPPVPVVSTAHSLVPAAHYLPGTGWAGCGAGHCTARRCTGIQVTSNGPEMQEIMFYVLRRSWALNSFQGILRLLPFTVKITNIQKYQCQVKSRHEVYIMKIIDHHESQYGTFCRINRFSYHNIVFLFDLPLPFV